MKRISGTSIKVGIIMASVLAIASMEGMLSGPIQRVLSLPSARVASFFLGASPIVTKTDEVLIPMSDQFISITSKCSAFGFLCILYAMLAINILRTYPRNWIVLKCVMALPLAYVIAIFANGSRIVCAYYVHLIGQIFLPANYQAALHQGVGIAVFLSTLMLITVIFERTHRRER